MKEFWKEFLKNPEAIIEGTPNKTGRILEKSLMECREQFMKEPGRNP